MDRNAAAILSIPPEFLDSSWILWILAGISGGVKSTGNMCVSKVQHTMGQKTSATSLNQFFISPTIFFKMKDQSKIDHSSSPNQSITVQFQFFLIIQNEPLNTM